MTHTFNPSRGGQISEFRASQGYTVIMFQKEKKLKLTMHVLWLSCPPAIPEVTATTNYCL